MRTKHEHSVSLSEEVERNIDFLYHSTADHVNKIAKQAGDPNLEPVITSRLVRLLEAKTLWESFRDTQSLPQMRPERNSNGRGRRAGSSAWFGQETDLPRGSSGTRTLSAKAKKAISKAQRERWAAYHAKKDADRARWRKSKHARRAVADPNLTAAGKPRKRILSVAQLESMRANAKKARAAHRRKKRGSMSEEQRAKISASMKAVFAAARAAGAA